MANTYTTLVGAPPIAYTDDWFDWYRELLALRVAYCMNPRKTTYYVSNQYGSDSNAGTYYAPFKTMAKVQTVHDASSGNIAFLFKRGDEWNETGGLLIDEDFVFLGTYGAGAKPFFNRFTLKYNQTGWTVASGDRWTRTEATDVAWVRNQFSRLTNVYTRVASTAAVESTPLSFYYTGTTLHINSGVGVNPNKLFLEAVGSNSTVDGIALQGDGCVAMNLRLDGWGCSRTVAVSQKNPYVALTSGTDEVLFIGMEGYYAASHVATFLNGGGSGGFATFIDCKAGYTKYAGGETIFNTYSLNGEHETIFHNCECTYGTLPSSDWVSASVQTYGGGFYGHTGNQATNASLIITYGCRTKGNKWGAISGVGDFANLPTAATIDQVRCFNVGEVYEYNLTGGGLGAAPNNTVRMNGVYYLNPAPSASNAMSTVATNGWAINNYFEVDLSSMTSANDGVFCFYNFGITGEQTPHFWGNHIHAKNMTLKDFCIEYEGWYNATNVLNGEFKNNIFSSDDSNLSAAQGFYLGIGNNSTRTNNAYYGITQAAGLDRGYDNHANKVALSAQPTPLHSARFNSQLYHAGTDLSIDFDMHMTPRHGTTPSIGPADEMNYPAGLNFNSLLPKVINQEVPTEVVKNLCIGLGDDSTVAFQLPRVPVVGTVQVYVGVGRQVVTVNYTIAGDVITFVNPPPKDYEVLVDFEHEI